MKEINPKKKEEHKPYQKEQKPAQQPGQRPGQGLPGSSPFKPGQGPHPKKG